MSLSISWFSLPNWELGNVLGAWTSWYREYKDRFSYKHIVAITSTSLVLIYSLYSLYQSYVLYRYYPVIIRFSMEGDAEIRLQDDGKRLFKHVYSMYRSLTKSESLQTSLFYEHWEFDTNTGKSVLHSNHHIERYIERSKRNKSKGKNISKDLDRYIDKGISKSKESFKKDIDDINKRVKKLNDEFKIRIVEEINERKQEETVSLDVSPSINWSLFSLTNEEDGLMMLNYSGYLYTSNYSRALWHLAYIRNVCQVLEKWNSDRHDLRSLSDGLGNMMFEVKPLHEWDRKDWALLNEDTRRSIDSWHTLLNQDKGWIQKAYDRIIGLGANILKSLTSSSYSFQDIIDRSQVVGNPNMLANAVDPITGEFTDQNDDSIIT